jgi:hypothetical protein
MGDVFELVGLSDGAVRDVAAVRVEAEPERAVGAGGGLDALVGDRDGVADRGVGERPRARVRDRAGHVGDAVVDDAVHDVGGVIVRGGAAGGDAAALIDRDVDDDAARAPSGR